MPQIIRLMEAEGIVFQSEDQNIVLQVGLLYSIRGTMPAGAGTVVYMVSDNINTSMYNTVFFTLLNKALAHIYNSDPEVSMKFLRLRDLSDID